MTDWIDDEIELLDAEERDPPVRFTRDDMLTAADAGCRRHGWRFDDMRDDQ